MGGGAEVYAAEKDEDSLGEATGSGKAGVAPTLSTSAANDGGAGSYDCGGVPPPRSCTEPVDSDTRARSNMSL